MRANVFVREYTTKQGETRFTLIVRQPGHCDRSIYLGPVSRKAVKERRIQVLHELLNGTFLKEPVVQLYFGEFVEKVFRDFANGILAPKTARDYNCQLRPLLGRFRSYKLNQIRREDLERYFSEYRVSGQTKNHLLAALRLVFKKAVEWRYLRSSPVADIRKFPEESPKGSRALTPAEVASLLNQVNPYQKLILQIMINSGMRPGELSNLKLQDIDWESGRLGIVTDKTRKTKNRKTRYIPMNRDLKEVLLFLKDNVPVAGGDAGVCFQPRLPFQEYIFCHANGGKILSFKTAIMKAFRRNDIKGVTPHGLRKTFCSMLARSKVHPRVAQQLMGHSDINLTMKVYTEIDDDQLREAVNLLPTADGLQKSHLQLVVGGQK